MSHARYQLGVHVTGLPGCGAACKDDRTLSGLVCGSEKFTELSGCLGSVVELFDAQYRTVE